MQKIRSHVEDALSKGAVDSTPENSSFQMANTIPKGNYVAPVVLTNVNHDMVTMKEETFGPVMPIMKVASDAEAIALMNDSDYGLTASVWTKDIQRGEELIDQIEAGTVFINRGDYPSPVSWPCFYFLPEQFKLMQLIGSCMDGLEDIGTGLHSGTSGLRWIREVEELPYQRGFSLRDGRMMHSVHALLY